MIISLLPVLLLSVGLILDFCFHHTLVKEPVTVNPVSLMFKVLKYAAKHKYPVQRSAFTYCENERPTRLDYGKSKYGGPFTTEQVEDVKTFWRILLVIVVLLSLHVSLMPVYESAFVRKGGIESESKWIKSVVYVIISPTLTIIRASVDALCRDGTSEISRDPRTKRLQTRRESLARPSKHTNNNF